MEPRRPIELEERRVVSAVVVIMLNVEIYDFTFFIILGILSARCSAAMRLPDNKTIILCKSKRFRYRTIQVRCLCLWELVACVRVV